MRRRVWPSRAAACWQSLATSDFPFGQRGSYCTLYPGAHRNCPIGRRAQEARARVGLPVESGRGAGFNKGWAAPEYQQQSALARELADRLGDHERLVWAMYAQWVHLFSRAEHQLSLGVARELMTVAEHAWRRITKSVAHYLHGRTPMMLARYSHGPRHLERSLALDDPLHGQVSSQKLVATRRDGQLISSESDNGHPRIRGRGESACGGGRQARKLAIARPKHVLSSTLPSQ